MNVKLKNVLTGVNVLAIYGSSARVHPLVLALIGREFLAMHFPGHWVGRDGPIPCPPPSPDIMPLDFFLWGYVRNIVHKIPMTCLDEVKLRIFVAIARVTPQSWRELGHLTDNTVAPVVV
jgi:hypothetical protein